MEVGWNAGADPPWWVERSSKPSWPAATPGPVGSIPTRSRQPGRRGRHFSRRPAARIGWAKLPCPALLLAVLAAGVLGPAEPALSQEVVSDTAAADSVARGVSPRGAMLRSMLVPGWGQTAAGSTRRAAVFFTLRGTSAWMIFKTLGRLNEVRGVETRLVSLATDSLNALIATDSLAAKRLGDPLAFAAAVDSFPGLDRTRGLVRSREQQRQDWIAYTIFFTLLDGIDAYVNAHFRDFPVSIDTQPAPGGGGRVTLTIPAPWGGARPERRPMPAAVEFRPGSRRR